MEVADEIGGGLMDVHLTYGNTKIDLLHGECIERMKELPDHSIDVCITSPPYWKGFEYEAYFNSYKQYLDWTYDWMKELKHILKKDGTFYLNVSNDAETTIRAYELLDIAKSLMYKLHDTIIWYRYNQQPANTDRQLTNQTEFIFMLRHTSANTLLHKDEVFKAIPEMFKTKNAGNVWELPFNSGKGNDLSFGRKETKSKWGHSGFPVQLPKACILLSSNEGDTILDMFNGSGTTGVACIETNRNYIGIDMCEEYITQSKERLQQAINDKSSRDSQRKII